MTAVFDGIASVVNDVFGDTVTIRPLVAGGSFETKGIFRRTPIEVASESGEPVFILAPTLRVRRDLAPDIARGDLVESGLAPGQQFRVVNKMPSGSPASDGFIVCELEEVD